MNRSVGERSFLRPAQTPDSVTGTKPAQALLLAFILSICAWGALEGFLSSRPVEEPREVKTFEQLLPLRKHWDNG